jgi:hypothetical protein
MDVTSRYSQKRGDRRKIGRGWNIMEVFCNVKAAQANGSASDAVNGGTGW